VNESGLKAINEALPTYIYAAMDFYASIKSREEAIGLLKFINNGSVTPIQVSAAPYHYTDDPEIIYDLYLQSKKQQP
jgi:hypothetical protein